MAKAVDRLLSFYPPLDVSEPELFIAGIGAILSKYPPELITAAIDPSGIPSRLKTLRSLAEINQVCSDLYDPIERQKRREAIANQPRALPSPPRSPELQAEIDRQIENWRKSRAE